MPEAPVAGSRPGRVIARTVVVGPPAPTMVVVVEEAATVVVVDDGEVVVVVVAGAGTVAWTVAVAAVNGKACSGSTATEYAPVARPVRVIDVVAASTTNAEPPTNVPPMVTAIR